MASPNRAVGPLKPFDLLDGWRGCYSGFQMQGRSPFGQSQPWEECPVTAYRTPPADQRKTAMHEPASRENAVR